ncbi:MAG: TauD/TfdA family dioxygenase [Betaproteobacteria bacterium]|nr:TauD/TfdA family dioxygenase [Betaproteobacteria bacterium]
MNATVLPQTSAGIKVEPLPYALGAYVTGVDLRHLDDAAFAVIHAAWLEHLVIVIRGQQIGDDDLTAFSSRFGVLDEVPIVSKGQAPRYNKHISVISNIREKGVPIGGLGDDEVLWHSDTSYRDQPPSASVLQALEIPLAGGNTGFSNMYLALETLPPELRSRIDTLTANQDITYTAGGELREGFTPVTDVRKCPGATHPLIRTHPETKRNALYLGRRRNAYIHGLEVAESEALLDTLWAHATQDFLAWHHQWRVGDVAVWDNRCVMHHRDPFDPHGRRIRHRAQARDGKRPARDAAAEMAPHPRGQRYLAAQVSR